MTCLDNDSRNSDTAKVGGLNLDGIAAGWHKRKAVGTVGSRGSRLSDVRTDVCNDHGCVWHYRACRVRDRAGDDALYGL